MKKIVGIIAAAAMAANVFAAVGVGAWGRSVWAPVASDGNEVSTFALPSWAWDKAAAPGRIGFSISGSSDNIGFNLDFAGENGGLGDTQFIWVKPWSFLELQVGRVQDNSARGDGGFGAYGWLRNSKAAGIGEDLTFMRFGNGNNGQAEGAIVKVTPIDGLWIEAALNGFNGNWAKVEDVYKNGQYGIGYNINGIGHIRAQYIGVSKTINAAFDLSAVKNLSLTIGGFIPTDTVLNPNTNINAYASYTLDALKLHALAAVAIAKDVDDPTINAGIGADYSLSNGIGFVADVRGTFFGDTNSFSFLVGATKGFSNGVIGIGFQGVTQSADGVGSFYVADGEKFGWQIPVKFEYWF